MVVYIWVFSIIKVTNTTKKSTCKIRGKISKNMCPKRNFKIYTLASRPIFT